MKTIAALAVAIAVGTAIVWIAGAHALSGAAVDGRWASAAFEEQLPRHGENESATRILATTEKLGDFHKVRPALREVLRGTPPSPAVVQFLDDRANLIRTLRAEIISNPAPVWAIDARDILDGPEAPLSLHLQLYTIFGADAAVQRARENERAAASDLRAVAILARSLEERPEIASLMIRMVGYRIASSASSDLHPALLRTIEYEAWRMRTRAERYPLGEPDGSQPDDAVRRIATPLVRPFRVMQADVEIGRMHRMAAAVAATDRCAPLPRAEVSDWQPLFDRINRMSCRH